MNRIILAIFLAGLLAFSACQCSNKPEQAPVEQERA